MAKAETLFENEADLVAKFCAHVAGRRDGHEWVAYHETCGWDLLMVHTPTGIQVGIEAKMTLNAKVLAQALQHSSYFDTDGPDYRAVLVVSTGLQNYIGTLAEHLGLTVIEGRSDRYSKSFNPELPDENWSYSCRHWTSWCPAKRCALPDYVPDVTGGKASPVALTQWKVKAIKLLIVLDRRGYVTRADMKALDISPSRWTQAAFGFLIHNGKGGYIRWGRTPDLKAQHPRNWSEIEADFATWAEKIDMAAEAQRPLDLEQTTVL